MKNPTPRTDGFYCSGPVEWEDWHAGVHMRETHHDFWRFYPNGIWLRCTRYEPEFDFWEFANSLTAETIEQGRRAGTGLMDDGMELFVAGTYSVVGDSLTTRFERRTQLFPSGEQVFTFETHWTIHNERLRSRDRDDNTELRFSRRGEGEV